MKKKLLAKSTSLWALEEQFALSMLLACVITLFLAGTVLFQLRVVGPHRSVAEDIRSLGDRIRGQCAAAVAAGDVDAATEILQRTVDRQSVRGAALVLPDGRVFAQSGADIDLSTAEATRRVVLESGAARLTAPVMLGRKPVATLNLVSHDIAVWAWLRPVLDWALPVGIGLSLIVSIALASGVHRLVSSPIRRLAGTVQAVIDRGDYSLRTGRAAGTEMRVLTEGVNQMLARFQKQDQALKVSKRRVEAILNSIDGVLWQRDPDTLEFTYVSPQCLQVAGCPADQLLSTPHFWRDRIHPDDVERVVRAWLSCTASWEPYTCEYRVNTVDGRLVWISERGSAMIEGGRAVVLRGMFQDITEAKTAARKLETMNQNLVKASRLAGRAEVATGVLHNVGNVLNSVSVCANVLGDHLSRSKVMKLFRAAEMIHEKEGQLAEYLTADPKGKMLPAYVYKAAKDLAVEQSEMLKEVALLAEHIQHIKQIVAMQQTHAKVSGAFEHLDPASVVEDALRMNVSTYEQDQIEVVRDYQVPCPEVNVDYHKVLQILVNLLQNARHALAHAPTPGRRVVVRVEPLDNGQVAIRVIDNGSGIEPQHFPHIFQHGFTTRKDGHGFGLHSSANAAKEVGGSLNARSAGAGAGAEFTLELPVAHEDHCPEERVAVAALS